MTTAPDDLRRVRSSYSVAYLELLKIFSRKPGTLFCFLEGKDSPYYGPRLVQWLSERVFLDELELFDCGGKAEVLKVRDAVDKNPSLRTALCIYFVDRDFGRGEERREDTFVTDGYSLETYYFGPDFIKRVLKSVFFGNRLYGNERDTYDEIVEIYSELQEKYLQAVTPFNRWAYALRLRDGPRIRLSVFDDSRTIEINIQLRNVVFPEETTFDESANVNPKVDEEEIKRAEIWLVRCRPYWDFRGKQHMSFVLNFLNAARECQTRGEHPFKEPRKVNCPNSLRHFVRDMSAYAATPPSLLNFLSTFYDRRMSAPT